MKNPLKLMCETMETMRKKMTMCCATQNSKTTRTELATGTDNHSPRRESSTMATNHRKMKTTSTTTHRLERVLAKVRQRQLDLAIKGQIEDSARYAGLAQRVRRQAAQASNMNPCCAA